MSSADVPYWVHYYYGHGCFTCVPPSFFVALETLKFTSREPVWGLISGSDLHRSALVLFG